ncbi:PLP-dependent aminotransferase family protein [Actinomadura sp. DC4]|uniref:MocR-like pyridoxine biosynthesis transcription factor PdxR n=1 Tax=Actinomadura sp. DC4 TaxID=3055069 RepID=UPI0025AEF580|nr:PLP-dependent aminotransferase family protein [Actinomadura sp. DC4]MDN3359600.1 PLP-dependent aminotransferase family protein [Actinomadura sp. DC4]
MVRTWAVSGVDLHLDLTGTRVRATLESALREAVSSGRLAEGVRLPSSRALAADLGIARNTVADAYSQLVAEGWLTARSGSGTWVAARPATGRGGPKPAAAPPPAPVRYDLRPGSPSLSSFPRTAWLAAGRRALSAAPAESLGYGDPRGLPELRTALAGYLSRARGVHAGPEHIVVCSGFTQALGLIARVLRSRGAANVGVEAYGHRHHREVVTAHDLRVVSIPVDDDGAVLEDPVVSRAEALLLTPAHQFPLGVPLAAHRRTRAVQWAHDTGGLVVEDDYDGEFRYDRQPVGALQALAPDHVVYAGTASKSLAPGLRLGWLALPAGLVEEVAEAKRLADAHTSTFEQLTLAEFIASGDYDRHVRRCRTAYRRRRDRLVTALRREVPEVRVTGVAAGLHALLDLPPDTDEDAVVARAAGHGLALEGLRTYNPDDDRGPALVVGYATPPDHSYTGALARLCATLTE